MRLTRYELIEAALDPENGPGPAEVDVISSHEPLARAANAE